MEVIAMRSTIDIDDQVLAEAMKVANVRTKKELIDLSLKELVRKKRRERLLAKLGNLPLDISASQLEKMRSDE
jgi:Arc/MetJ family transcription regulator